MKKTFAAFVMMTLFVGTASAESKTLKYPQESCAEILSSGYSLPSADSSRTVFQILCKDSAGNYSTFIASWASASGFLGFGRAFHDDEIKLIPYPGNTLTE